MGLPLLRRLLFSGLPSTCHQLLLTWLLASSCFLLFLVPSSLVVVSAQQWARLESSGPQPGSGALRPALDSYVQQGDERLFYYYSNQAYYYSFAAQSWQNVGITYSSMNPTQRFCSAIAGYTNNYTLYTFDSNQFTWTAGSSLSTSPIFVHDCAMVAQHGLTNFHNRDVVYVFGGVDITSSPNSDLWSYSVSTNEWTSLPTHPVIKPSARSLSAIALYENNTKLLVYGGANSEGTYLFDLWIYDLPGQRWVGVTLNLLNLPRAAHVALASPLSSRVYIVGGQSKTPIQGLPIAQGDMISYLDGLDFFANEVSPGARTSGSGCWTVAGGQERFVIAGGVSDASGSSVPQYFAQEYWLGNQTICAHTCMNGMYDTHACLCNCDAGWTGLDCSQAIYTLIRCARDGRCVEKVADCRSTNASSYEGTVYEDTVVEVQVTLDLNQSYTIPLVSSASGEQRGEVKIAANTFTSSSSTKTVLSVSSVNTSTAAGASNGGQVKLLSALVDLKVSTTVDANFNGTVELRLFLESNDPADLTDPTLCVGYINEEENKWYCASSDNDPANDQALGLLTHFTTFGVLLGADFSDSGDGGSSNDVGIIVGVTVSVSVALFVVLVVVVAGLVFFGWRLHRKNKRDQRLQSSLGGSLDI